MDGDSLMNKCNCCMFETSCEFFHDYESECSYSPISSICKECKDMFELTTDNRDFCSVKCKKSYMKRLDKEKDKLTKRIKYKKYTEEDIDTLNYICLLMEEQRGY